MNEFYSHFPDFIAGQWYAGMSTNGHILSQEECNLPSDGETSPGVIL